MNLDQASVLVVDDVEANRDLLCRRLKRQGYHVQIAEDGLKALELIRAEPFDLVLLDIMMPHLNGYQVLEEIKADPSLRHIPVIMISAVDDIDSVVKCIELGAEDYLSKPFNPVLLKARISASLEKKRLRDQEQAVLQKLQDEQAKSELLLLNILPKPIAERLKAGERTIADNFSDVTVLFADIVGFSQLSSHLSPPELVEFLNHIFSLFDELADKYELEKIKTIGDAYMVVGGLPMPRPDHAQAIAQMALDMIDATNQLKTNHGEKIAMRIGISTGSVEAGVIGTKKFSYDLWGDTVNTASRMESHGIPGRIQVTTSTYECLANDFLFENRGMIPVKGKGEMLTYLLMGKKPIV